jgi:hypothetical protein
MEGFRKSSHVSIGTSQALTRPGDEGAQMQKRLIPRKGIH